MIVTEITPVRRGVYGRRVIIDTDAHAVEVLLAECVLDGNNQPVPRTSVDRGMITLHQQTVDAQGLVVEAETPGAMPAGQWLMAQTAASLGGDASTSLYVLVGGAVERFLVVNGFVEVAA